MFGKKKPQVNVLTLTPNRLLEHEYRDDNQINVLVPRFSVAFLQRLMPKKRSPYIKANLDELGTATWELIDGHRTVSEIAESLSAKYDGQLEQPYERVAAFIQAMHRNNFIALK
jgi:hypothetical protein